MKDEKKTCPSSVAAPGAQLIGVVNSGGIVDILKKPLTLDAAFVEEVQKGRSPEQRFRFAGRCVQSGCNQWKSGGCSVIQRVTDAMKHDINDSEINLPACGIRKTCRWYFQKGKLACAICPLITTDNGIENNP
ncbi:MAG: hypothetical protein HYZ44_02825 [Bacteroidetes bacterium]|nr:hypothetical protein [Bacteroidota bacterium]